MNETVSNIIFFFVVGRHITIRITFIVSFFIVAYIKISFEKIVSIVTECVGGRCISIAGYTIDEVVRIITIFDVCGIIVDIDIDVDISSVSVRIVHISINGIIIVNDNVDIRMYILVANIGIDINVGIVGNGI